MTAVPHAATARAGVRDGPGGAVGDVVARKRAWLASHPGGTVGRPRADELVYAATVCDVELARAYDDLANLMDLVDAAEADGRCPLHPQGGPS
jgi:hypothetical protein